MNNFFARNTFIVNQKVFTIANSYKIEDEEGKELGHIQEDLPLSLMIMRWFVPKSMTPFTLNIEDADKKVIATAKKKFSFLKAAVEILDETGNVIAKVKEKLTLLKPEYEILDPQDQKIGKITGNWIAWDYKISDVNDGEIASINKKFQMNLKELFTDADKYAIQINPEIQDEKWRTIAIMAAGIIDKVNREKED